MSTKTSFKRIALVAVAALGFGMLSVVPSFAAATAAATTVSSTNTNTYTSSLTPVTAGTALTFNLQVTPDAALASGDTGTATYTVAAGPAAKAITSTCTFTAATVTNLTITVSAAATGTFSYSATGAVAVSAPLTIGTASCPSTIGGLYTVTSNGTFTPTGGSNAVTAATAPGVAKATGAVYVSGGNISQGLTRSTTDGSAVVGGAATALFTLPTHTTDAYSIVSSGVGSIATVLGDASSKISLVNGTTGDYSAGGIVTAASAALTTATVTLSSTTAGVQTIKLSSTDATTGVVSVITTLTVTYGSVAGVSASFTSAGSFIGNGSARPVANATSGLSYPKTSLIIGPGATTGATIAINVFDTSNVALNGQAISATIAGPGLISLVTATGPGTTGTARAASLKAADQVSASQSTLGITADGTAGTAVVTVSSGSTVLFTKTVVFYGTVTTLTATQNFSIAKASSSAGEALGTAVAGPAGTSVATTPAVIVVATDANGNAVTGLAITVKSADTTIIGSGSVVESDGSGLGDGKAGPGSYNASVTSTVGGASGASTTVVFRTLLADGVTYVSSAPVTFTLGGSLSTSSVTAALDKASYSVGDAASLVLTVKDSKGNPVYDQDANLWGGIGTAPGWSKSVVGLTPSSAAAAMIVSGKKTYKGYVPSLEGSFTLTGVLDASTVYSGAAIAVSATVGGSASSQAAAVQTQAAIDASMAATDAANEATDAANAATDAANNAMDSADAAQQAALDAGDKADAALAAVTDLATKVSAIASQISTLSALVAKIAASVAKISSKVKA